MLRSLWEFNPRDDLNVYIVHSRLDSQERAKLVGYLNDFIPAVSFLHVDDSTLKGFPESAHVKLPSYYRLFLPDILPVSVNRVMYLDSDLIVNGNLDEFWSLSLEGYLLAAASDRNLDMQRARLGLAPDSPYFNAGVMLLNLSDWRQLDVGARGLLYAQEYPEKLPNCDQDVLNHLFEKRCRMVEQRWNAMSHLWGLDQQWLKDQGGSLRRKRRPSQHLSLFILLVQVLPSPGMPHAPIPGEIVIERSLQPPPGLEPPLKELFPSLGFCKGLPGKSGTPSPAFPQVPDPHQAQ